MNRRLLVLPLLAGPLWSGCVPVTGDRILGRDLALADPRLSALPASLIVGYVAAPGLKRVIGPAEVQRIARASNIAITDAPELCFEIPMRRLNAEDVVAAMRHSLPDGAELRIVELPAVDVPAGDFEFPLTSLEPRSRMDTEARMWRGSVRYSGERRAPVWARVVVSIRVSVVVAGRDLPANVVIDPSAITTEVRLEPLARLELAARVEDAHGRVPKRMVKAGEAIPLGILEEPLVVRRGDAINVEVLCGTAVLKLSVVAERDARRGEMVELRNPSSGKTFRARMDGGKAVVIVGSGQSL